MNILRVRCHSRKEFDEHFVKDFPAGGMFCPTTKPLKVGEPVIVELHCDGLPNKVLIRGAVRAWRPALPRMRVRAGATVEFADDESPKRDFILETLGGERKPTPRRRHTRIPIGIPARFRSDGGSQFEPVELREISISGALIAGVKQPPIGSDVVVELVPPGGAAPMAVSGRVMYHTGSDQTGVRFLYREGGGSRRLRELVRRFKAL